jgi:hypothetical protein
VAVEGKSRKMTGYFRKPVFLERPRLGAVRQTVAAAGALVFDYFVHVMDILHLGMDRALGTDFAAQAAGNA